MIHNSILIATLFTIVGTTTGWCDEHVPANPPLRWWKGNLHTHSLWSDGNDFPEMISEWYRTHGYHFLAISDHNILSEGQRWMPLSQVHERSGDRAFAKYLERFGNHWVEVRDMKRDGQAGDVLREVRLKPLYEYRALLEERGRFILLSGEEVSDSVAGMPVHMNVTNLKQLVQPLSGDTVTAAIRANLRSAHDQAKREGREVVVHLNHPNFHYAIAAQDLAPVIEERFFEVYNGHPDVNHLGDSDHPSVERMWDLINAIRLTRWPGTAPMLGLATDDRHNYHNHEGSTPGRGWIMVQARHLTPESLIRAINRAQFYASSGVALRTVEFDKRTNELSVEVEPKPDASYQIDFIGTRYDPTKELSSDEIGITLSSVQDNRATYRMEGNEIYVRAVVTSSHEHPNPSHANQHAMAWTQPVVAVKGTQDTRK